MNGNFPVWIDRSDDVVFEAKSFISKSEAVIERAQQQSSDNGKKPEPGRKWYAEIKTISGGKPMPTMRDFIEKESERRNLKVVNKPPEGWMDLPIQGVD